MSILLWIQENLRTPILNKIFVAITTLGNGGAVWLLISAGLLVPKKTRKTGILSLIALGCCAVVTNVCLKNLVARTRPYDHIANLVSLIGAQSDFSFPSGHTSASFAAATVIWRGLGKKYGIAAMTLAVLIGCSRLYVGVHYPSDVIGGALIGSITGILVCRIAKV